jgi:integrase
MARAIARLTAVEVRKVPKGMHADGGGLWLHVNQAGARSWIFRFMLRGRAREMGLGPVHTIGLAEARKRAQQCRQQLLEGIDPIEARQARRASARVEAAKAISFKECAEAYIATHQAGWKNPKHAAQWPATLGAYVYPICGDLPVQAIDTALVMKVLEQKIGDPADDASAPLWTARPETASRVRGRIECVLDWAAARGYRHGENPARWRGHLDKLLPKKATVAKAKRAAAGKGAHHEALPYAEVPAFMAELRQQNGIAARALEFAILTATRTGEVIGARWDEIDLTERLWTIPAERMKAGKEHRVSLAPAALAIVAEMAQARNGAFVFAGDRPFNQRSGGRPISNMAMLMLLRRMGRGDITVHGFRSSFRDWAAERTGFPAEVAEMALAHVVADKLEAAYRRGDLFAKRRQIMEAWAKFCAAPAAGSRVVPLRQAAE